MHNRKKMTWKSRLERRLAIWDEADCGPVLMLVYLQGKRKSRIWPCYPSLKTTAIEKPTSERLHHTFPTEQTFVANTQMRFQLTNSDLIFYYATYHEADTIYRMLSQFIWAFFVQNSCVFILQMKTRSFIKTALEHSSKKQRLDFRPTKYLKFCPTYCASSFREKKITAWSNISKNMEDLPKYLNHIQA